MGRTFAIGDIHGELDTLEAVIRKLPAPGRDDTIVFLGDYLDRGPDSAGVVDFVRFELRRMTPARVVALRGNHEDGWLRVVQGQWPHFVLPEPNGCLACYRSYTGGAPPTPGVFPTREELDAMITGSFLADDVVEWMRRLPLWYEDEYAIYVHAGVPQEGERWLHPSEVKDPKVLIWTRAPSFFKSYRGKRIVVGHTPTPSLPPELSSHTPADPLDMWVNEDVVAIDTGCGKVGGFLTAVELPAMKVYESMRARSSNRCS